jgi:tetratricopeptide (TPR) repeat protein
MALNEVLWTIDNELDHRSFERLAVDLLHRNGYREIVPIEPQDGGRDAEEHPRRGRGRRGEVCFFQFTRQKDGWKSKLRDDAQRLHERGYDFDTLIFLISQKARGVDVDRLTEEIQADYGWDLIVFSREWLRLQLEEVYPDLAKKYLDVEVAERTPLLAMSDQFQESSEGEFSDLFALLRSEKFEQAAGKLHQFTKQHPESSQGWYLRAITQYRLFQYDEALASLNRASQLGLEDEKSQTTRASILTEKGIAEGNRSAVEKARTLFRKIIETKEEPKWDDLYNLGNALSALGEYDEAIDYYQEALDLSENRATVLKNLASAYHQVGDHDSEMEYLNRALELAPTMPEALTSKGISLLTDFNEPDEAAVHLERGVKHNPDWIAQYPTVWYWLGLAHYRAGELEKSIKWLNEGLAHQPGFEGLERLKSEVLAELLEEGKRVDSEARQFWERRLQESPRRYGTRLRLIHLEKKAGNAKEAWNLIDDCFEIIGVEPTLSLRKSGFSISQCIKGLWFLPRYAQFRHTRPISDYWDESHTLYDLSYQPPKKERVKRALRGFLAVPFGLGMDFLFDRVDVSTDELLSFFDTVQPPIERAVSEAGRFYADSISDQFSNPEVLSNRLSEISLFTALIALREGSAQQGWIASQSSVSQRELNVALSRYNVEQIQENVVISTIETLNDELEIFPEGEGGV